MKIGQNVELVESESEGFFETTEAGIAKDDQGYLFEVLSKRLYSNPEGTIVREITSNCFDSHVEAEVEKPVVIKFTYDEGCTFMSFFDFGVGLSPDRIKKVYMNYFSSTKRQTNTQIGGFGLGSKSPLSYTNSFFIITQFQGSRRTYLMSQAAQKPTLELLLEEECPVDENGTEVKIPLKNHSDIERFCKEIQDQLFYFDNVFVSDDRTRSNGYSIDVKSLNEYQVFNFKTFKFRPQSNTKAKMHLVIDKVTYPIDFEQLKTSEILIPIAVKFEIGELEVTPSRESVLYNDAAVKLINQRINEVFDELTSIYVKQNEKTDFMLYTKAIGAYFEKKSIFIDLEGAKEKISISLDNLSSIKINSNYDYLFPSKKIKTFFPPPQYNVFISAGYRINYNMFSNLDWYRSIQSGKLEDIYSRNQTSLDLLTNLLGKKPYVFDAPSDRIKNRYISKGELLKSKSFIEFYKHYTKNNQEKDEWKFIDLSKENKITKLKRLYKLFLDEVAKITYGYYSQVELSQSFKDILEQELISKREEFKDKMKIEICDSGYMYENKVMADYFKDFDLIVYSERRQEVGDQDLIRGQRLLNQRLKHTLPLKNRRDKNGHKYRSFKFVFITSAKRNIESFIKHLPKAIYLDEFLKTTTSWEIDYQLVSYIKTFKSLDKIFRNQATLDGLSTDIHEDIRIINLFVQRIKSETQLSASKAEIEKLFKNHPIYHRLLKVDKYFKNLEMLRYIDAYNMDSIKFKKVFRNYLKLNNKKLDPAHYMEIHEYELAMLNETVEKGYQYDVETLALINGRYNYHPTMLNQQTLLTLINDNN